MTTPTSPDDDTPKGTSDEHTRLMRPFEVMINALREIAHGPECYRFDEFDDVRDPNGGCDCPPCTAKRALEETVDWRFQTNHKNEGRRKWNPRERKIVDAWRKQVPDDNTLSQILWEDNLPSVRDWYVATTVVQWLATNIGMGVVEAAGFKYVEHEADRAEDTAREDALASVTALRIRRLDLAKATPEVRAQVEAMNAKQPIYAILNRRHQVTTTGTKAQLAAFAHELLKILEEI